MIEKLLRDFAAVHFEEDGNYFPVSHSRAQEIRPLTLMAKKERSFWERPLKQYKYVTLSRMEKYAERGKEQELLDALNLHVKKEDCDLTPEEDNESEDEEEEELLTRLVINFLVVNLASRPHEGKLGCKACRTKKYCSVAFEWSYFRISSTDSKGRTTLYSIINSTTGKYCSVAFI